MNKKYLLLIILLTISNQSFSQDDVFERSTQFRMGIGCDITQPSVGIHLTSFYKVFNLGFTYYMPKSSSDRVIEEIQNGYLFKAGIAPLYLYNGKYVFPIYIGIGYSIINEKDRVLNFSGDGKISGYHYFAGFKSLPDTSGFWRNFGTQLELGYSSWNYDDSILKKNNSDREYKYSKFFFSFGLSYYFF